jgi:hypothetical protein
MTVERDTHQEIWIPTRGLSFPLSISLAASIFLAVVGGLYLYLFQTIESHPLPFTTLLLPISIVVVGSVFIPLFPFLRRPATLSISSEGVTIEYPRRRVRLPWNELMRLRYVGHDVMVFRTVSDTASKFGQAYQVSLLQARAILSDPRCPHVALTGDQRRLIFED